MKNLRTIGFFVFILFFISIIWAEGQSNETIINNISSPQLVLDADSEGETNSIQIEKNEGKGFKEKKTSESKEKKGFKTFIKDLELVFESSFGYSVINPTVARLPGSDNTLRGHFGSVPVFGFSLKIIHKNTGLKLGYFYQRSNPSYFQLDDGFPKYLINYTLEQFYVQIFYNFNIGRKIIITPFLGYLQPNPSTKRILIEEGIADIYLEDIYLIKYIDGTGPFLSIQSSYKLNSNVDIFLIYNLQKRDNLSFGLSFKVF